MRKDENQHHIDDSGKFHVKVHHGTSQSTHFVLVQQDDKQYTWTLEAFFFLSLFNLSYSTLYLNNSPFLNLQSWIFSTLTCKVTLASSRLRFGVQMSALNIIFWPSSLSHNVQNLDNGCYLEMSHLDVTKVFYHSAGAHAMNQQQHERCSVTLGTQCCFTEWHNVKDNSQPLDKSQTNEYRTLKHKVIFPVPP